MIKKLLTLVLLFSAIAMGVQFYGHQSVVNLGVTSLFTAPASGIYFVQGNMTLPNISKGDPSNSRATVQVSKNGITAIYVGEPGASGFAIPAVTLATNDAITVSITSDSSVDSGINKIKGDVFFGNAF